MSASQLKRLLAVLVLVVVAWGIAAMLRRARTDHMVSLKLPRLDTATVDTMSFIRTGDSAIVVRKPGGAWRVNGFRAQGTTVQSALAALADTSNRTELAARSASAFRPMGVTADSGRLVHIATHTGTGFTLLVGHSTGDDAGVFVRNPSDSAVYALHGPLSAVFSHSTDSWRDKTIATLAPDSVTRIEVTRRGTSYALVRTGSSWRVAGGAEADSQMVRQFLERFHPLDAVGFASAAQEDSLRNIRQLASVRLFKPGVATPVLSLRIDSTSSGGWVRADSTGTIYGIEGWSVAQLAPPAKSLLHPAPKLR